MTTPFLAACTLLVSRATAATVAVPFGLDAQALDPVAAPGPTLVTETSEPWSGPLAVTLLTHHADDPLVWRTDEGEEIPVVEGILSTDLRVGGALAAFRYGLHLPLIVADQRDAGEGIGFGESALFVGFSPLRASRSPVGLALVGRVGLPLWTVDAPVAPSGPSGQALLALDRQQGPVLLALNVGGRVAPAVSLSDATLGTRGLARFAAAVPFGAAGGIAFEAMAEADLAPPLFEAPGLTAEWLVGGWARGPADLVIRAGAGTGLTGGVGAPDHRILVGVGWEPGPRTVDADDDGVSDRHDRCAGEPEDRDGFDDGDGCPDPDNDGDGVADVADRCPDEADDPDAVLDADGCPDPETNLSVALVDAATGEPLPLGRLVVTGSDGDVSVIPGEPAVVLPGRYTIDGAGPGYRRGSTSVRVEASPVEVRLALEVTPGTRVAVTGEGIQLLEPIRFVPRGDALQPSSLEVLGELAQLLRDWPELGRVRIVGLAEGRGTAADLTLARNRAQAVVDGLALRGVDRSRLEVGSDRGGTAPGRLLRVERLPGG